MNKRNIHCIVLATGLLLLVPLVAMQFTHEVRWSVSDFVVASVLLIGTGLTYEFATKSAGNLAHKAATGIAVAAALLLVWVNLAVGIIGSENNPANLMYLGVLAVGVIGAMVADFKPAGMARAMFATAATQALVAAIALAAGLTPLAESESIRILFAETFFVALWAGAGLLFQHASRQPRTHA